MDLATYLPDLTHPLVPAQHAPETPVASPGSLRSQASDMSASILGQRGH
jgi:hypothetical protein